MHSKQRKSLLSVLPFTRIIGLIAVVATPFAIYFLNGYFSSLIG